LLEETWKMFPAKDLRLFLEKGRGFTVYLRDSTDSIGETTIEFLGVSFYIRILVSSSISGTII
jgi:hypothetical protein